MLRKFIATVAIWFLVLCRLDCAEIAFAEDVVITPAEWTFLFSYPRGDGLTRVYQGYPAGSREFTFTLSASGFGEPVFADDIQFELPPVVGYDFQLKGTSHLYYPDAKFRYEFLLFNARDIRCWLFRSSGMVGIPAHDGLNIVEYPDERTAFGNYVQCVNSSSSLSVWVDVLEMSFSYPNPNPDPSPSPSPTVSPSPDPSPSSSPSPEPRDFELKVTVDGTAITNAVRMPPSVEGCGALSTSLSEKGIKVECVNKTSGKSMSGCTAHIHLEAGSNNGGHPHDSASRPLGTVFFLEDGAVIPADGIEAHYAAPEVAGDVELEIGGVSPEGEQLDPVRIQFRIAQGGFVELGNAGLQFNVASHPEGDKGTLLMKAQLEELVSAFDTNVRSYLGYPIIVPTLESEAGSLPQGGVFDYKYGSGHAWTPPHCGHRDGMTADISVSTFSGYQGKTREFLIRSLQEAFDEAGFRSVLESGAEGSHWHIHIR
jgi:hypothetical protein